MEYTKTTGRCPDLNKGSETSPPTDFKTAVGARLNPGVVIKRLTPHDIFLQQHQNLLPQGGMFTFPKIPVEHNFRSETLEHLSNFISDGVSMNPLVELLKLIGIEAISVDLLFIALAILNLQYKNTTLRLLLGAVFGYSVVTRFLKSRESSAELFEAYSDFLSDDENSDTSPELNMEEIYEPQGFQDSLPIWSSAVMVALHSVLGFKPKNTILKSLIEITKINEVQRENVSLVILKMMGGIGSFFHKMEVDNTYTRYFDVEDRKSVV